MKNRIEKLLKRFDSRVDYLEIRMESSRNLNFAITNDELQRLNRTRDAGFSIRACYRGGWGFTSLNSPEKLEKYTEYAVSQARKLAQESTHLAPIKPVTDTVELKLKTNPDDVSLDAKLDLFRHYIQICRDFSSEITITNAFYTERFRDIIIMTTDGTDIHQKKLDLSGIVVPNAHKNGLTQSVSVQNGSCIDFDVLRNWEKELEKNCRISVELLNAPPVRGGRYPVIVDPVLGSTFAHEAFGHMSEADDYQHDSRQKEIFTLGKRFGSDELSIYDTGLDTGTRGFIRYDDEGVPTEKTELITNGILTGRLHSRESAAYFNEKPTGNARTINYRYPPICRMRNTCIAGGTSSFDDLLESIPLGVYAVGTHGGTGGEMFSFDADYGYMIRNGKIAELVRDVQLSGNLFKTLKAIDRIGNDFKIVDDSGGCGKGEQFPLETTCSSPHLRIREAIVGGTI